VAKVTSKGPGEPVIVVAEQHLLLWAEELSRRLSDQVIYIEDDGPRGDSTIREDAAIKVVDAFFAELIETGFRS